MAGGPKTNTDEEFLEMVRGAIDAGGRGVAIGRNVFQHDNPTAMTRALTLVVHKGLSVDDAMEAVR
jgi:fructose-bisphosphate aldolase/2-amino-3,7-dideoxy-D-threo-hept-6-ulosonate synthase